MNPATRQCANELLEVVPLMMRIIRAQVRAHSSPELSVAQFRALAFLGRNQNAMLGDVANFLALTLPAASKLIDGLVGAGYALRAVDPADRRRAVLTLTPAGEEKYATARKCAADFLAARVDRLPAAERQQLLIAIHSLQTVFSDDPSETAPRGPRSKAARNALA